MGGPEKDRFGGDIGSDVPLGLRKRVALLDVPLYVDEAQCRRSTVAFAPHVFIQIGRHHPRRCSDHLLTSALHSTPVGLDVVGAYTRNWIGEVLAMAILTTQDMFIQ